jgi:hypothetical protein
MTDEREYDDIGRELHAMRAEPRPEYARELDRRAAGWLSERPRRRLPSLRIAIPAAAGAAAVAAAIIALVVSGGDGGGDKPDRLAVTVITADAQVPSAGGAAPEALEAAPVERRSDAAVDVFALESERVPAGQPFTVRYQVADATRVTVALAGLQAEAEVGPGPGTLQISTEGLPAGVHRLTLTTPRAPAFRGRVEIAG